MVQIWAPTMLKQGTTIYRKQNDVANVQANFYQEKVRQTKEGIPGVNYDPLEQLSRAFSRWKPKNKIPVFQLSIN